MRHGEYLSRARCIKKRPGGYGRPVAPDLIRWLNLVRWLHIVKIKVIFVNPYTFPGGSKKKNKKMLHMTNKKLSIQALAAPPCDAFASHMHSPRDYPNSQLQPPSAFA